MTSNNEQSGQMETGERLLNRKLAWTKRAIFLEDLWLKLWPLLIVLALFVIAALFEVWSVLTPLLHRFVLALFVFAALFALYPLLSLRWPGDAKALKRLDKNSILPHQPAQAFKDKLAPEFDTKKTRTLWALFKQSLTEKIKSLRVPAPKPNTAAKDPFALRMLLLITMAVGLFIQSGNLMPLLSKSWQIPPMLDIRSMRIDAWVTPPSYTDQPPILVSNGALKSPGQQPAKLIKAPENAILTIRINGKNSDRLSIDAGPNQTTDKATGKKPIQGEDTTNSREFSLKLTESGRVALKVDEVPLTNWNFEIIDDTPPIIGLIEPPGKARSSALKLAYKVVDDYGAISAKAHLSDVTINGRTLDPDLPEDQRPLGTPPVYPLNLPEQLTKDGRGETFKDLTRHPWAGLNATLHLSATDEGGNTSKSPEIKLQIPAYNFTKPLAKNIIRMRHQLILSPHKSLMTANSILALTANKQSYKDDLGLYLGMRVAANRLGFAKTRKDKEDVAELLYELARQVEDGDLSKAEQALRTAQEALRDALRNKASEAEIQKRIDELRRALQRYMQALAEKQKNQNNNSNQQAGNDKSISPEDFERMLKTIEELSKSGSKDLAQQMLSQMQNMLENMQTGKNRQQANSETSKDIEELSKLLRQQQKLMDETFNKRRQDNKTGRVGQESNRERKDGAEQNMQGELDNSSRLGQNNNMRPPGQENSLAQKQMSLKERLDQLMRQMKDRNQGQSLDEASKAMQRAQQMLQQNDLSSALTEEGQALDKLRQGIEQMAQQLAKQQGPGGAQKRSGKNPQDYEDGNSGLDTSEKIKIPEKIDIQRAREILRSLQDKMSDPNRRALELDYFERLLKRF